MQSERIGGRFTKGSKEAQECGRKGGSVSTGKFTKGYIKAIEAGRKGGKN